MMQLRNVESFDSWHKIKLTDLAAGPGAAITSWTVAGMTEWCNKHIGPNWTNDNNIFYFKNPADAAAFLRTWMRYISLNKDITMKLQNLSENSAAISNPVGMDLDVATRLGPTIQKHLVALETLARLLPNSSSICSKLAELKSDFESCVSMNSNVLEKDAIDIVNLTLEQQLHSPVHPAVKDLETELKDMGKTGNTISNSAITAKVNAVASRNKVTPSDLDKMFKATHGNATADHYVKLAKDGVLKEQERIMTVDDYIASSFVMEMYETMKPGLGDKAWVAISKRLKAEGYEHDMVESIINRAIYKISNRK